jgi:hypothetical protein
MQRTSKKLIYRKIEGIDFLQSQRLNKKNFIIRIVSYFIILIFNILFANTGDYLIVENPAALHLLNSYEQRILQEEKSHLGTFVPFRIIDSNHLLSDSYTRAIKTSMEGQVYYIAQTAREELSNNFQAGTVQMYRNVHIVEDTVRIKQNNRVFIQMNQQKSGSAEEDELLVLIFEYKNDIYIKRITPPVCFGWIDKKQSKFWEKYIPLQLINGEQNFPVYLINSIQAHIDDYNRLIQKLFVFFNHSTRSNIKIPSWNLLVEGNQITCRLENKPAGNNLEKSKEHLIRRIKNILPQHLVRIDQLDNTIILTYGKKTTI